MQATTTPIVRDIVLIGGGHSHVVVLRRFAMQPLAGVRLTVLCTDTDTPYSGMLPGYIAGHYDFDAVHIDLRRLAEFAGARYFRDEVVGIDRSARSVLCRTRPALPYDLLSINIGSTPRWRWAAGRVSTRVCTPRGRRSPSASIPTSRWRWPNAWAAHPAWPGWR